MSDEPKEQPQEPQKPDFSQPAPSMWETFAKKRVEQAKDNGVTSDESQQDRSLQSPHELDPRLVNVDFYDAFKKLAPKYYGEYGNDDINVKITAEIALENDEYQKDPFYKGEILAVSPRSASNEKVRRVTYEGKVYPEYIIDNGKLFRISNTYEFTQGGEARKSESIHHIQDRDTILERHINLEDIERHDGLFYDWFNTLPAVLRDGLKELNFLTTDSNVFQDLEPGDYELLRSILEGINNGTILTLEV